MIINRENGKEKYIPENWKERLKIDISDVIWRHTVEGKMIPRWFIPVRRSIQTNSLECWVLPLAPFAWLYFLLGNIFHVIWLDAFRWNELVAEWKDKKVADKGK